MAPRTRLQAVPDEPVNPGALQAADMPLAYLECHAEGHWWQHDGDTDIITVGRSKKVVGFVRHHVCTRCGELRKVTRGQNFQIMSRSYRPPEGYRLKRDGEEHQESHRWTAMREILSREGIRYD